MSCIKRKLLYFNLRGQAEPIRFLLVALNVPFEDVRVTENEWVRLKTKIPTQRLPYLEVTSSAGSVGYSDGMATARLIARKNDMMGNSDEEYYKVERIIEQCSDIENAYRKFALMSNGDEKTKLKVAFINEIAPSLLKLVCRSLQTSGGNFVAGEKPSFGVLYMLTVLDHVADVDPNLLECSEFAKHREFVLHAFPSLAEYIRTRPSTPT
ncbi:unnamed protein product [Calicophoron daubneyi]|uniref:GST N-terminal domain-containing protein n=1 Tax=Calicophoron daubneyi TaxID=300641 RepID=A0AAV2T9H8_CALDB